MSNENPFSDLTPLGKLSPQQAAVKLREVGEDALADKLEDTTTREAPAYAVELRWPFRDKAWQHTAHAFGYLAPTGSSQKMREIRHAGSIRADPELKGKRIKITLGGLRVADYPGGSTHHILFDFYAQNQLEHTVENLHFNATYRAREGERAAIIGYPIFVGLNVGGEGVQFRCSTLNVKNEADEQFLGILNSDVFKSGLRLATVAQPAIAPFSEMALGLTKAIAGRSRNQVVQEFYMGLDFSDVAARARLAEGTYLAVQVPESLGRVWDWQDWVYDPTNGLIHDRDLPNEIIPYNYVMFSISRFEA